MEPTTQLMSEISPPLWMWIVFHVIVFALLSIDLGFGQRRAHSPKFWEAIAWVGFYVAAAGLFALWIFNEYGPKPAILFVTGYLVEYSLSVDNLFVFVLLFSYFAVPSEYRHRVLFWGIIGALFFRGVFVAAGAILISRFEWILYIFGAFLVYTAIQMVLAKEDANVKPENNLILRWMRKRFPVIDYYDGARFFSKQNGKRMLTPLILVLIAVETTDILFAVDSIPAIFSITSNPFLVYTSNIFAILGLRSLFFVLDRLLPLFRYLKLAIALILAFIGVKMLVKHWLEISAQTSLVVVAVTLFLSIILSVIVDRFSKSKSKH